MDLVRLKSSHVAILGTHPETLDRFDPVRHNGDEVWGMAHHDKTLLYATKAFEAHSPEIVMEHGGEGHVRRLKRIASVMPLFTMYPWPGRLGPLHVTVTANDLVRYGAVRMREQDWNNDGSPIGRTPFIESSIAYMIAMAGAVWDNDTVSDISLYGVNMDGSEEYQYQMPNICYLIGRAEGRGINVHLPPKCTMLRSQWTGRVYGHPSNVSDIVYHLKPEGVAYDDN